MKELPILMSAPMVRAQLDGTKTQTRRPLYVQTKNLGTACFDTRYPPSYFGQGEWPNVAPGHAWTLSQWRNAQPGDVLWVRETYFAFGRWETRFSAKKARDEWHFIDLTLECGREYLFAADGYSDTQAFKKRRRDIEPMYWKRPAIFMPRAACRLEREVVSVRVERLQDISDADAIAEGIERSQEYPPCWKRGPLHGDTNTLSITGFPKLAYRSIWEQINGHESWAANPWVVAIAFKPLETT